MWIILNLLMTNLLLIFNRFKQNARKSRYRDTFGYISPLNCNFLIIYLLPQNYKVESRNLFICLIYQRADSTHVRAYTRNHTHTNRYSKISSGYIYDGNNRSK